MNTLKSDIFWNDRLGWVWKPLKNSGKDNYSIPPQMKLTRAEVIEIFPELGRYNSEYYVKGCDAIIERNNQWCINYGICLYYKKDGKWYTNFPLSHINNAINIWHYEIQININILE